MVKPLRRYLWRSLVAMLAISLLPIPTAVGTWWLLSGPLNLTTEVSLLLSLAAALSVSLVTSYVVYFATVRSVSRINEHLTALSERNYSHHTGTRLSGVFNLLVPALNKISDRLEELSSRSQTETAIVTAEAARLRNVINSIKDGVLALDKDTRIVLFNKAAAKITGFSLEEAAGRPLSQVLPLLRGNTLVINDWLIAVEGSDINSKMWEGTRLKAKDGKTRSIDADALYQGADPNGIRTLITFNDRTEAQEVEDMKVDFVALAAHELRTPVTVIRGYLEILTNELGDKLTPEHQEFMRKLTISASQLSGFINNILQVSQIEHGDLNLKIEALDWLDLVKNICVDLTQKAQLQGKNLSLNLPAALPPVAADRSSIIEVVTNIVDNAIKYSERGTTITVEVHQNNDMVETTVVDQGVGIPVNAIDKLFTKFYRSHRTRASHRGTGLGLYMSKSIVEAHGGSIWVKSQPDVGSTFGFLLPVYAKIGRKPTEPSNKLIKGVHGWIKNHSLYRG